MTIEPGRTADRECGETRELLFSALVGELSDIEAETVFFHLARCRDCRRALADHARIYAALEMTPAA